MLKEMTKAVVFVTSSAVAIPYAVAFLANVLCGWPQGKDKYQRAFHPRKVYALNYAILQQLGNIRYAKLYFMWKLFYANDKNRHLIKDLKYGTNENKLDVYLPQPVHGHPLPSGPYPVVVFVYGGAWGSGDKSMYGLLCDQLSNTLQAVVCCPNYSIYPRGCVDDMVQDIVDCLSWIHNHIHEFGGDKERIMLVGHSAGAHLSTMAVLELTMKRLLHDPHSLVGTEGSPFLMSTSAGAIQFEDQHFDGTKVAEGVTTSMLMRQSLGGVGESSTGSFYVVGPGNGNNTGNGESGNGRPGSAADNGNSDSFILVGDRDNGDDKGDTATSLHPKGDSVEPVSDDEKKDEGNEKEGRMEDEDDSEQLRGAKEGEDTLLKSHDLSLTEPLEVDTDDEANISKSQREVRDILSSVRAVIGLSGVYDIADHYDHETWRGIEDISAMCRSMYGPENFNRFSPSWITGNLPQKTRLPPFQLLHGECDITVPVTSSVKFSQMVHNLGAEASLVVLPECPHVDICLDLMDPTRRHHDAIMGVILETAQKYLTL